MLGSHRSGAQPHGPRATGSASPGSARRAQTPPQRRAPSPSSARGAGSASAAAAAAVMASSSAPPSPARRKPGAAPQPRALHPAVLPLPPAPKRPSAALGAAVGVVDEVPTDAKGRPYPYVQPPVVPGTCPTVACVGSAAEKQVGSGQGPPLSTQPSPRRLGTRSPGWLCRAPPLRVSYMLPMSRSLCAETIVYWHTIPARQARGLQPLLSPSLVVRYGGVANAPVRASFREAGFRPTRTGKRWLLQWGGILDADAFARLHAFQRVNHFPGVAWSAER